MAGQNKNQNKINQNPTSIHFSRGENMNAPAQKNKMHFIAQILIEAEKEVNSKLCYKAIFITLPKLWEKDLMVVESFEIAKKASEIAGYKKLEEIFAEILKKGAIFETLYKLAYHLVSIENYQLSIIFLEKLYRENPQNLDIIKELAGSYNSTQETVKAVSILDGAFQKNKNDFWLEYEFVYTKILLGIDKGVEEFIQKNFKKTSADKKEGAKFKAVSKLKEILARKKSFSGKPQSHIRDWQFIQYGSCVLDYHGYLHEGAKNLASGRWVDVIISRKHFIGIVGKFVELCYSLNLNFDKIYYLPDRDSEILGRVLGMAFDIPILKMDSKKHKKGERALVCGADARAFSEFASVLREVDTDKTLFSLNLNWTKMAQITPDFIGLMSQICAYPWQKAVYKDMLGRKKEYPADTRKPEEIAADLIETTTTKSPYFDDLIEFYKSRRFMLKYTDNVYKNRLNFLPDSPLPGKRV